MQDNQLDSECANNLIELLHDNYFIEDLVIDGNNHVSQTQKETIQQECRKNLMIKEFILPHLKSQAGDFLKDTYSPVDGESHFKSYNVESLQVENMNYLTSDFICKFIEMNKNDFHSLILKNVSFERKMKGLVQFLKSVKTKITTIAIEDCDTGANLPSLIEACKGMETLEELRLINMGLNVATESVLLHLYTHKKLTTLDLSNNRLTSMTEIASLLANNQVLTAVNLSGNAITTADNFTALLLGMADNMSVTQLSYEVSPAILPGANNRLGIDEEDLPLLDEQLRLNRFIQASIVPKQTRYRVRATGAIDFSK